MKHKENFIKNGTLYLVRCESCDAENYGPAVSTGICAWCGWPKVKVKE